MLARDCLPISALSNGSGAHKVLVLNLNNGQDCTWHTSHHMLVLHLQVADEHNLDVAVGMAHAPTKNAAGASKTQVAPEDDLGARLAELRGK